MSEHDLIAETHRWKAAERAAEARAKRAEQERDDALADVERLREAAQNVCDTSDPSQPVTNYREFFLRDAIIKLRAALAEHDSPATSPGEDGAPGPE